MEEVGLAGRTQFSGADLRGTSCIERLTSPGVVLISNRLHNVGPDACAQFIAAAEALAPSRGLPFALLVALCSKGGAVLNPGLRSLGQARDSSPNRWSACTAHPSPLPPSSSIPSRGAPSKPAPAAAQVR